MVLVDSSVWIDHLRRGNRRLHELLDEGCVLCHPFVIGELACGNLRNRSGILDLLANLPAASMADHAEVLKLLEIHGLHGQGIGWADAHLLASALLTKCRLWSQDKRLRAAAKALGIAG